LKKRVLYFLFLLLNSSSLWSNLTLKGVVYEIPDRIHNCAITIHENGTVIKHVKSNKEGGFSIKLNSGHYYTIEFSKKGYISKKIEVNTKKGNIDQEYKMNNIAIDLFKENTSSKESILKNPIAIIVYDIQKKAFSYDMKYNQTIQQKVQEVWFDVREKRAKRDQAYAPIIAQADAYFDKKDYFNAKTLYLAALEYREMAKKPNERIAFINGLYEVSSNEPEISIIDDALSSVREETGRLGNKIITRRFVSKDGKIIKYHSVENPYGQIYYFKKNLPITPATWVGESTVD